MPSRWLVAVVTRSPTSGGEKCSNLVFCDVMMPDTSGMEVYEAVREECPEMLDRLVFMSGGTFTERARQFRARVRNAFVDKPIDPVRVSGLIEARAARIRREDVL